MAAYFNKKLDWNSVDARGADGLLHYGRIIDCAEEGLFIDFGCGTAAQQFPFDQMYRCKLEKFRERDVDDNSPVDVLWRCRPEEPPTWYPGALLTGNFVEFDMFRPFALVHIITPAGPLAEIVTTDRVRRQRSAAELGPFLLEEGLFVKEEVQLPSGVSSGSPSPGPYQTPKTDQRLVKRFNHKCSQKWMVATHIDASVLHVLKITDRFRRKFDRDSRSSCPKLERDTFFRMLGVTPPTQRKRPNEEHDDAVAKRVPSLPAASSSGCPTTSPSPAFASAVVSAFSTPVDGSSTFSSVIPPQPETTTFSPLLSTPSAGKCLTGGMKRRFRSKSLDLQSAAEDMDDYSFSEELSRLSSSGMNQRLPKEILADIFECLLGVTQARLRNVCVLWNDILTNSRMFRVHEENRLRFHQSGFIHRASLLKCWTAQTKIIIYVNPHHVSDTDVRNGFVDKRYRDPLLCTGRLFRCIFQENQLPRLGTLLLVDIAWQWPTRFGERSVDFSNFVNHIRDELNSFASVCHNLVLKDVTVVLSEDKTPVVVCIRKARIGGEMSEIALWDLMEKSLLPLNPADLACWAEWMRDNSDDDLYGQLVKILNERQSADPRDSNQFRFKSWMHGDLANLELEKLNRITSHSLLKACCFEKLILVLNW